MAFSIIRNSKYKLKELNIIFRHNERKNTNYSNDNIDKTKSIFNYSLKPCNMPYSKKFQEISTNGNDRVLFWTYYFEVK